MYFEEHLQTAVSDTPSVSDNSLSDSFGVMFESFSRIKYSKDRKRI